MGKRRTKTRALPESADQLTSSDCPDAQPQTPAIKLRIKIGQETVIGGTKSFSLTANEPSLTAAADDDDDDVDDVDVLYLTEDAPSFDGGMEETEVTTSQADSSDADIDDDDDDVDDDDDDDSEWLNAGCEVSQFTNTDVLTTRRRAMLTGDRGATSYADERPISVPVSSVMSEEQAHRRQLRAKKRREKAAEKNEKDKRETVDRLLKKQDSKTKCPMKVVSTSGRGRRSSPIISYVQNAALSSISLPHGYQFPIAAANNTAARLKPVQLCGVAGCQNVKKYACSRSGVPLCSLQCYQRNLTSLTASSSV